MNNQINDLINILQTGDEWEAAKAAERLGQLRAREAIPALMVALYSQDLLKDWNALDMTSQIAFGGVGEGLVAIQNLRCKAAKALGVIGDVAVIPELLAVFRSDNPDDVEIRYNIAKILANFPFPEVQRVIADYSTFA